MNITELIAKDLKEKSKKYDDFLRKNYALVENEFGKMIKHNGVDYFVVGLTIERNEESKLGLCDVKVVVNFTMMIVLKSSFFDEIKIPVEQYIHFKGLK